VQAWLRDLGLALGFNVWIANNDRSRAWNDGRLGDGCLAELPSQLEASPAADTIRLIDVIWIEREIGRVAAAFEVEHTTSIYSGIMRMLDLALGADGSAANNLYLVAPDSREADVRAQIKRPAFSRVSDLRPRFLPYSELDKNRDAMARFGSGLKAIEAVAKAIV
jgi:type II restriction enzyme